jgi:hypothetical protein
MIPKLISQSRTTEVNTASSNTLMAFDKKPLVEDTHMVNIFTELRTYTNELTSAINRSKAESNLDKKDVARDEKVKALNYILMGAIHHPDAAVKAAGENLNAIFSKYGLKMTQTSYATESSLIDSLLEDFAAPTLQTDIAAVSGCAAIIAELQAEQNDFKASHFSWEEKKAQEGLTKCATDIKKDVVRSINEKIVLYLNAMSQANATVYGELAQTVAQIINDNNEAVKKRSKKEDMEPELSIDE